MNEDSHFQLNLGIFQPAMIRVVRFVDPTEIPGNAGLGLLGSLPVLV